MVRLRHASSPSLLSLIPAARLSLRQRWAGALALAAGVALVLPGSPGSAPGPADEEAARSEDAELRATPGVRVAMHLDEPLTPGATVVWTAAFQAAWDALGDAMGGQGGIPLGRPAPAVDIRALNDGRLLPGLAPPGAMTVISGPATDATWRAVESVSGQARPVDAPPPSARDLLAFARLQASVRYTIPFALHGRPLAFGPSKTPVRAYGLLRDAAGDLQARRREQVRLHLPDEGARDASHQAVIVLTATDGSRVVLSGRPAGVSLRATWEDAASVLATVPGRKPRVVDRLAIPRVALRTSRSFDELVNVPIEGTAGAHLALAREDVSLRVDERGADVDAEATLVAVGAVPLDLELDGPFLVAVLAPGRDRPYVLAWIGTVEPLSAWGEPEGPRPSPAEVRSLTGTWTLDTSASLDATARMSPDVLRAFATRHPERDPVEDVREFLRSRFDGRVFDVTIAPDGTAGLTAPGYGRPGRESVAARLVQEASRTRLVVPVRSRSVPEPEDDLEPGASEERWSLRRDGQRLVLRCEERGETLVLVRSPGATRPR